MSSYSGSEDYKIINYWANMTKQPRRGKQTQQIWHKFIAQTKSKRTPKSLHSRFRLTLAPKLWKMGNFGKRTKVKVMFNAQVPVDSRFLRELRKNAEVKTDDNGHITYYKEEKPDGLELIGAGATPPRTLSPLRKKKKVEEERKKRRITVVESESDESVIMEDPGVIPRPIPITPLKKERDLMASNEMEVMVTSLKEMFTSQTCLMRQLVQQRGTFGTTATTSLSPQSSGSVQVLEQNSSKKAFLYLLRGIVLGMDHPELDHIRRRINTEINRIGKEDKELPLETVKYALEGVLDVITNNN